MRSSSLESSFGGVPRAPPRSVGMRAEQLARVDEYVQRQVAEGKAPMMGVAVVRRGRLCFCSTAGSSDVRRQRPFERIIRQRCDCGSLWVRQQRR